MINDNGDSKPNCQTAKSNHYTIGIYIPGTVHVNCLKINDKTRESAQNVYVHVYLQCV